MERTESDIQFDVGDVIEGFCDPVVKVLRDEGKGILCDNCFPGGGSSTRSTPLLRCMGCKSMHYCNQACQLEDWRKGHKLECKCSYFSKKGQEDENSFSKRKILRLFFYLKMDVTRGLKKYKVWDGSCRSLDALSSHEEAVRNDPDAWALSQDLSKCFKGDGFFDSEEVALQFLLRLGAIWISNGFSIPSSEMDKLVGRVGDGIFVETAYFEHSCRPNAGPGWDSQGRMQVRAIAPIKRGASPSISYLNLPPIPLEERRGTLRVVYNFECKCERCLEEGSAGEAVNYPKLMSKITSLMSKRCDWYEWWAENKEILVQMRKLYNEYDGRITNLYNVAFEAALTLAPPQIVMALGDEARRRLVISFGEEDPRFKEFSHKFVVFKRENNL